MTFSIAQLTKTTWYHEGSEVLKNARYKIAEFSRVR